MTFSIRSLDTIADCHACEVLQSRVWALPDGLDVVPLHLLLTVQRNGGVLLGAFDGGDLVGFVFGFPGYSRNGRPKHCSHMMGVAPGYQGTGIGYRLKLAQRQFALDQGLDLMTWTYDPLESRNAYLNSHKLGTVCRTYIREYYGPMEDGLNAGLPSDRFQVEWCIADDRVVRHLEGQTCGRSNGPSVIANTTGCTATGLVTPGLMALKSDLPTVQVEIPAEYQAIKAADPGLALEWRLAMRQVFEFYFAAGYLAVDLTSRMADSGRRSFHILRAD